MEVCLCCIAFSFGWRPREARKRQRNTKGPWQKTSQAESEEATNTGTNPTQRTSERAKTRMNGTTADRSEMHGEGRCIYHLQARNIRNKQKMAERKRLRNTKKTNTKEANEQTDHKTPTARPQCFKRQSPAVAHKCQTLTPYTLNPKPYTGGL